MSDTGDAAPDRSSNETDSALFAAAKHASMTDQIVDTSLPPRRDARKVARTSARVRTPERVGSVIRETFAV